jgi:uncharacterized protein (DUF983 family)
MAPTGFPCHHLVEGPFVQRNMNTDTPAVPPETVYWSPSQGHAAPDDARPPLGTALWRGARNRCPVCGEGKVFSGYLRVARECSNCEFPLGTLRADDAPPYFTIFIVGHLLLPPILMVERMYGPPIWLHMVVWLPLIAIAATLLLRPVKGATVGLMCRLGITGNDQKDRDAADPGQGRVSQDRGP